MRWLTFLALAACNQQPVDQHQFVRSEFNRKTVEVTVVEFDSLKDLRREADRLKIKTEADLMAFGEVSTTSPKCTIYVLKPQLLQGREWWGHELIHCVRGRWHE